MLPLKMNSERRMAMRAWHVGYSLFFTVLHCEAQGNLIPNSSFEEADTCAVQLGFFLNGKPLHWEPINETPDYFRSCVPYGSPNGVPANTFGFQLPQNGGSYAGLYTYSVSDSRESIGVQMEEPLTVGQTYYGSFWANAAYGGPQQTGSACNNIGMLFTMSAEPWDLGAPGFSLRDFAQIYSQEVISDTAGWTLVSGSFVADSAYQYLVMGNHFSNANTTVEVIGPGNPNKAYVLIDQVCLSTDPAGCPTVTSIPSGADNEAGMWINVANGLVAIGWSQLPMSSACVMDPMGRRLYEERVDGRSQTSLIICSWSVGCYLVVVEGKGGKQVKKFVVMQ